MRPGNSHGSAEFAGADVEQPFRAAITVVQRASWAKARVIRICGRCVECIVRRTETIALKEKKNNIMRCMSSVLYVTVELRTSHSVVNDVLLEDKW